MSKNTKEINALILGLRLKTLHLGKKFMTH